MSVEKGREAVELKIAYLGGGSRGWARNLMSDLAVCPDLKGHVDLYDINLEAARLNARLGTWIQERPEAASQWSYRAVENIEDALADADFVVCSIQPGPLEAMEADISIPQKYGLLYPVGDTAGAPGLVRGLRSAIIYADFAEAIAEHCPEAWVINYTNPMTICTRTLTHVAPELKVFGCCHEVFGTQEMLAGLAEKYLGVPKPTREEIEVNVLGINHFTWLDRADYQGQDLLDLLEHHIAQPGVMRPYTKAEVTGWGNYFRSAEQVKFALFERYGWLAAAGDRHLAEFVPGFLVDEETIYRYGFSRTPIAYRYNRWKELSSVAERTISGELPYTVKHSNEEAVEQMRALVGLGDMFTNVNMENAGQITNLPLGAVVETNARFSEDSVRPVVAGPLSDGVLNLTLPHVHNQEMIIEAALYRDKDLAFQAVFSDPLTKLPIDKAWEMFSAMLEATKDYLPGFDI
ncbi:MAG: alpha-glucosidase/alpha-galactosidase [Chloroflexi bacterium]|jgi:alpha-galactosidase/6-phospho-beta-glucosidase family protein|nr:alpha-glucosidase/alpha-galactosidase [Chloroflexota bacterium]